MLALHRVCQLGMGVQKGEGQGRREREGLGRVGEREGRREGKSEREGGRDCELLASRGPGAAGSALEAPSRCQQQCLPVASAKSSWQFSQHLEYHLHHTLPLEIPAPASQRPLLGGQGPRHTGPCFEVADRGSSGAVPPTQSTGVRARPLSFQALILLLSSLGPLGPGLVAAPASATSVISQGSLLMS